MTIPLVIQIQQAALDSNSSITDALLTAKLACTKLRLSEFANWVDLEFDGYMDKPFHEIPKYRQQRGTPVAYYPSYGWQPLSSQSYFSVAPIGLSIPAIEEYLQDTNNTSTLLFPYTTSSPSTHYIKLTVPQLASVRHTVRKILLEWTAEMEREGVLGYDLMFTESERAKSSEITSQTVINIEQIGAFLHTAQDSFVHGVEYHFGDKYMSKSRDTYQGNTGFTGPRASSHASNVTFNSSQQQIYSTIDLETLTGELARLRHAMMQEVVAAHTDDPDQAIAIAAVANAEKSARAGDAPATLNHLKSAGKWAWDAATKIGVQVAAKALKGAVGL